MSAPAVLGTAVVPAPRSSTETLPRPRRQRPRDEYWDVFEARWVRPGR
ncbi:hypothetical protein ACI797_09030 [Geodermatophilus sp. SYSU D00691]